MYSKFFFYPPPVHRIPVYPPSVRDGEYFGTSLRWCPHHLLPVRGGEHFGTSLRWCPHPRYFGLTPAKFLLEFGASALCLRTKSSPPYSRLPATRLPNSCSPAIRPGWRVLRQQLTLLGSPAFGTSAPCSRMVSSPLYSHPGNSVLRHQLTLVASPPSAKYRYVYPPKGMNDVGKRCATPSVKRRTFGAHTLAPSGRCALASQCTFGQTERPSAFGCFS